MLRGERAEYIPHADAGSIPYKQYSSQILSASRFSLNEKVSLINRTQLSANRKQHRESSSEEEGIIAAERKKLASSDQRELVEDHLEQSINFPSTVF